MKNVITNAAEITVLQLIDNTFKTGGGPVSVGATVIQASKGPVMSVTQVTDANWQAIFGKPLAKKAEGMEGLRHIADAVRDCNYVNVVRVVASDAKFPSLTTKIIAFKGAWAADEDYVVGDVVTVADGKLRCTVAHTAIAPAPTVATPGTDWVAFTTSEETAAHDYGTALSLGDGYCLQVWPIDGDPSTNRKFEVSDVITDKGAWVTLTPYVADDVVSVTGGKLICIAAHTSTATAPTMANPGTSWKVYDGQFDSRVTIKFYDLDDSGDEYVLESYVVGFLPTDKDDLGRPAYIETVLEQNSDRFRANFDETVTFAQAHDSLKYAGKVAFVGGTNGGTPVTADWKAAWDLFRNERYLAHLMFAAGNYDADVIGNCLDIAADRHDSFFFDVSPNLTPKTAIDWVKGIGLENRQAACYYSPFSANDAYYGGKTVWGVSGEVAAACARGDLKFSGSTPGIHYAPAGIHRGKLTRTGVKALNDDVINRDDFYDARINPVVASESGGAVIDDCLSLHYKQNYSRFIWVNRIANYIDKRFVEGAAYMKFEPDGLTRVGLTKMTKQIMDELVTSGALVTPRDPADGTAPYILTVEQVEIDLWLVTWDFCPTGAARRIAGQPRLIK